MWSRNVARHPRNKLERDTCQDTFHLSMCRCMFICVCVKLFWKEKSLYSILLLFPLDTSFPSTSIPSWHFIPFCLDFLLTLHSPLLRFSIVTSFLSASIHSWYFFSLCYDSQLSLHSLLLRFPLDYSFPSASIPSAYGALSNSGCAESIHSFMHCTVCLPTGPHTLLHPVLHRERSTSSSYNFQYPLSSLKPSNSSVLLLPRLPSLLSFINAFQKAVHMQDVTNPVSLLLHFM
jgi:hypothetical protein